MARRVVNGNSFSEDGWPLVDQGGCTWVTPPGTKVSLQIQSGIPATILGAVAADFNAYVEPLRDPDSASWTDGNSVLGTPGQNNGSNHLGGTAEDLNWNSHPFQTRGTFNASQQATVREIIDFYEGVVFWAGDWDSPVDEMHWQMGYDTYDTNNDRPDPKCQDFINRKIRPDGFSTLRRGAAPPQPAVMTVPLVDNGDGTWTSSSPAWAHLIMRESSGNPTIIQQIIDVNSGGNEAEGLFQITPRTWTAHGGQDFAPSARRATPQQQAIVAARIFTQNPTGSDWGAGLAGREDAKQLAAGLVPVGGGTPTPGDDDMANWTPELVARAMVLLENQTGVQRPSLSPFRHVGEGNVNTCGGFAWAADGNVHAGVTAYLAVEFGDPTSILLLWEVAQSTDPHRAQDAALARRVLAKVSRGDLDNADTALQAWLAAQQKAQVT